MTVLRAELAGVNQVVSAYERKLRPANQTSLEARKKQLIEAIDAHQKKKPKQKKAPDVSADPELAKLRTSIDGFKAKQEELAPMIKEAKKQLAAVTRGLDDAKQLKTGIETLLHQVETFRKDYGQRAQNLSIDLTMLVRVETDLKLVGTAIRDRRELQAKVKATLDPATEGSFPDQLAVVAEEIAEAEARLDRPSREYEEHLKEVQEWETSLQRMTDGTEQETGLRQIESGLAELGGIAPLLADQKKLRIDKVREIHGALMDLVAIYEDLYGPAREFIADHDLARRANLEFRAALRERSLGPRFWEILGRHVTGTFMGTDDGAAQLQQRIDATDFDDADSVASFVEELDGAVHLDLRQENPQPVDLEGAMKGGQTLEGLYDLVFGLTYVEPFYQLQFSGIPIDRLSPGDRGTLLLMFYLLVDPSKRPLLLDQPDENLDNQTIKDLLVPAIKEAAKHRQIIVVTHNPNVAVVADADQVVLASFDRDKFQYVAGAIENPAMNEHVVDVLEGTWPAFTNREHKYQPVEEASP